jgi:VCBS repeat-containing protein
VEIVNIRMQRNHLILVSALVLGTVLAFDAGAQQKFASGGTPLNSTNNYTWNRMTTINVSSGQIVPFIAYQFNTLGAPAGNYTFTMTTVGFPGAINLYQNSFDPTTPNANFYANGVVAGAAGTVSQTLAIGANQFFEVVFSAAYRTNAGNFTATISGPGNVSISVVTNTQIRVGPASQTILSGSSATLKVYGIGPLPHTWQWYGGTRGDTALPIAGATTPNYSTGPLINNTSYWVRVVGPANSGSATSSTVNITVTGNPNANYSGTLSPGGCTLQNGNLFAVQRFQIQQQGNYAFTVTPGFSLGTYMNYFDAQQPNQNLWGVLNGFYAASTYELVISKASPGGAFSGAMGGGPAIVNLLTPLPPQFLSSPLDTTIASGQTATLAVSATCGAPFTLQWYRGPSGNTNSPIPGATGFTYTTPALTSNTTYWVRMVAATATNNSGEGTVYIGTNPIRQSGALTACDHTFIRPAARGVLSGSNCFYKLFVHRISTTGQYTYSLSTTGFTGRLQLYNAAFLPDTPLVNLSGLSSNSSLTITQNAGANYQYLVVSGVSPSDVGTFDVSVSSGPALVTLHPAPVITNQPASTNVFFNQTATFRVGGPTNGVSYQWYGGSSCGNKSPIPGASTNPFVIPPVTDYTNYWVELTGPGGYLFSASAAVGVMPQAVNDSGATREDTALTVAAPALLANDTKAASRSLSAVLKVSPVHGTVSVQASGAYTYTPTANYNGPDSFTYQASDGLLKSAEATVNVTVTPVADRPSVTSATTRQGVQTTNGLVISRNAADGAEVTHFKITGIQNGLLFQNNGTTPINNNTFITFAQGNAGLRFTPASDLTSPTSAFGFSVQASTSAADAGLGGSIVTAVVTVVANPTSPTLSIRRSGSNGILSWPPPPGAGWTLQESSALPGGWTNSLSGTNNPVTIPLTGTRKFFRLIQ